MTDYTFEIQSVTQMKGHKIEKTKDYEVKVLVKKDNKVLFKDVVKVRKNILGVYPEMDKINKKIKSASIKKELLGNLKEYVKKTR